MRRPLRSAIKWSCTVLTVLLLVVWTASAWWTVDCGPGLSVGSGLLGSVAFGDEIRLSPPSLHRSEARFGWWFFYRDQPLQRIGVTLRVIGVPIWALAIASGGPSALVWYRERRREAGHCRTCNYDLRATVTGFCPECGAQA